MTAAKQRLRALSNLSQVRAADAPPVLFQAAVKTAQAPTPKPCAFGNRPSHQLDPILPSARIADVPLFHKSLPAQPAGHKAANDGQEHGPKDQRTA